MIDALSAYIRGLDRRRTLPMAAAYGIVMASLYVLKPARNALFLDRFGIDQLPFVLMLVALVGGVTAVAYARLASAFRIERLVRGTFLALIAQLLLFRLLLPLQWSWIFYLFYIWVNIYGLMATSLLWLLANAVFDAREARKIFGFIGTGGIAGAILGGLFTGQAAEVVGTQNLLLVCIGLLVLCLLLIGRVHPQAEEDANGGDAAGERGVLGAIGGSDLLRALGGLAALMAVVTTIVDVQFNEVVDRAFPTTDGKAAFFGSFFAYLSGVAFLFQVLLVPRILTGLGVGVALLFLPVSLALGSVGLLLIPGLWGGVLGKLGDGTFRYSIHKAATEILYLPVPADIKRRTKVFLDTTVDNLATGLGALLVLLLTGALGVAYRHLSLVSLGLIGLWVVWTLRARRAYVDGFRIALQERSLDLGRETIGISDAAAIDMLGKALESRDEHEVLYALDLLETASSGDLVQRLVPLVRHPSPAVRRRALSMLLAAREPSVMPEVIRLLNDESIEVRMEAVHFICQCGTRPPMEQMQSFLTDSEDDTRAAAAACLALHHQDESSYEMARRTLEEMLRGERGDDGKRAAAKTLEVIGDPVLQPYLFHLLEDASPAVVVQAIESIGVARRPEFVERLVEKLGDGRFRGYAMRALARYGRDALEDLGGLLADESTALELRLAIARVLGMIPRQETVDLLAGYLEHRDWAMRYEVVRALNTLRGDGIELQFPEEEVRGVLKEEAEEYREISRAVHTCCDGEEGSEAQLLRGLLGEHLEHTLERIFLALGVLYGSRDMRIAYLGLTGSRRELRPGALEFLDNVLGPDDRRLVMPLVERSREGWEKVDLESGHDPVGFLYRFIRGEDVWLRAVAVYTVGLRGFAALRGEVEDARHDRHLLVREAADFALAELDCAGGSVEGERDRRDMIRLEKAVFLHGTDLFAAMPTSELASMAELVRPVEFASGQTLALEGEGMDRVCLIASGQVDLYGEEKFLGSFGQGEVVALWRLFAAGGAVVQVVARVATVALCMERRDLIGLMDIHPEVAQGVLRSMVGDYRRLRQVRMPERVG